MARPPRHGTPRPANGRRSTRKPGRTGVIAKDRVKPQTELDADGFRELFESANVGIAKADAEDRFVAVNPKFCELLGYSREELLQLHTFDLVHPDDVPESRRLTRLARQGEIEVHRCERRYRRKDGSVIWVDVSARTVRDAKGKERFSLGVISDISKRKQAEAALARNEERLRVALEGARLGTFDWSIPQNSIIWSSGHEQYSA